MPETIKDEENNITAIPNKLDFRRSESFFRSYANTLRVNLSHQDASIVFGEILESSPPGSFFVEDKAEIRIPLSQAKILANVLVESIRSYEKHFGVIPIQKQYQPEEYRKIIDTIVINLKKQFL